MAGLRRAAVLGLLLACAGPAPAGVYSTAEPFAGTLSPDFRRFRDTLIRLRNLANPDPKASVEMTPLRQRYLQVNAQLARGLPDRLTSLERIDLGAALLRLGKYPEAAQVLESRDPQDRGNFLLLSNLATAYYLAGQEDRAAFSAGDALAAWPKEWKELDRERGVVLPLAFGWDAEQFAWYRKAEGYFRTLLRLRLREARAGGAGASDRLDALFPARFVGEGGKYEAGKISRAERDKLPKDALLVVEQLLVWLPHDLRLYWLLGELYNAQGDTESALAIFDDIVGKGGRFPELREHRRILQTQAQARAAAAAPGGLPPGPSPPPAAQPQAAAKKGDAPAAGPNPWQALGVGFLAGLLVALLGTWQVREILRRRQPRTVEPGH